MFPRPVRIPLRSSLSPRTRNSWIRRASGKTNPWPEQPPPPPPDTPKLRAWVYPVSRIANFLIVPTAILYAVFFADFGEHEHVFMPPRRWLEAQKAAFFSLSPEEEKLVGVDMGKSESPGQGSGNSRWCAIRPTSLTADLSLVERRRLLRIRSHGRSAEHHDTHPLAFSAPKTSRVLASDHTRSDAARPEGQRGKIVSRRGPRWTQRRAYRFAHRAWLFPQTNGRLESRSALTWRILAVCRGVPDAVCTEPMSELLFRHLAFIIKSVMLPCPTKIAFDVSRPPWRTIRHIVESHTCQMEA